MRSEIEWSYDRTEFRTWQYSGDEAVDVTPWLVPASVVLAERRERLKRRLELAVVVVFAVVVLYIALAELYLRF